MSSNKYVEDFPQDGPAGTLELSSATDLDQLTA